MRKSAFSTLSQCGSEMVPFVHRDDATCGGVGEGPSQMEREQGWVENMKKRRG